MYVDHDYRRYCAKVIRQKGAMQRQKEDDAMSERLAAVSAQADRICQSLWELYEEKGARGLGELLARLKGEARIHNPETTETDRRFEPQEPGAGIDSPYWHALMRRR